METDRTQSQAAQKSTRAHSRQDSDDDREEKGGDLWKWDIGTYYNVEL